MPTNNPLSFRQQLRRIKLLKFLASIKLTVFCLVLLFVLTLWGTIAQVQNGLYLSQQRFFHSFVFFALNWIPFPGGQLVMWALFVNLVALALVRLVYKIRNTGIIVIHLGLLLFLVSGYVTLHGSRESYLSLEEGKAANVSSAYHDWEIVVWPKSADESSTRISRAVTAFDAGNLRPDQTLPVEDFQLQVSRYYKNAKAFQGRGEAGVVNASGIGRIDESPLEKDLEKNTPAGIFKISTATGKEYGLLLYGGESIPTVINIDGKPYNFALRLKHYPLPFTLKLVDFKMEQHPGMAMARSFESLVEVDVDGAGREKLISMNNPLRYQNFTLYQSSYAVNKRGEETSILAVVENSGRLLPYVATLVTFAGLTIHFIVMGLNPRRKPEAIFINEE